MSPVSTDMGDCLRAGIPPQHVNKPNRSTCIPPGSLNWVPALTGCGKGRNVTSAGDPIWHVSSRCGEPGWMTGTRIYLYLCTCVQSVMHSHTILTASCQVNHLHSPLPSSALYPPWDVKKWVSALGLSNNNKWWWWTWMVAANYRRTHSPSRLAWSEG